MITQVRKTYKYRLYRNDKRDRYLHDAINIAGIIWNHGIALQRRYYRLFGGYIPKHQLQKHIAKLRMRTAKYSYWRKVGSQAVQDIMERLDKSYQRFFKKQGGRPSFSKVKKYRSFTLKQSGWKLLDGNKIRLGKTVYKFVKHRTIGGTIKTVTVKRDSCNRLWLCFSVVEDVEIPAVSTGQIGGFDFGLKTFLTDHTGKSYLSPEYFKQELSRLKCLSRSLSRKTKGSHNRAKTKLLLARTHIRRVFDCEQCDSVLDRDHNAALNIQRIGASMHTARGEVSPVR